MMIIPMMSHMVVLGPLAMYLWAAGSSSWHTMNTIIPPTIEKMMPTASCEMKGEGESGSV